MARKISKWTIEEEAYLKTLKENLQIKTWTQIAEEMSKEFPEKKRNGKQCRERYINFTVFQGNEKFREEWQEDECEVLYQRYKELGCQWKKISEYLPNRSENCVKNKFYIEIRKLIAKLNRLNNRKTQAKLTSIKRLLDLLQIQDEMTLINQHLENYKDLKHKILFYSLLKVDDLTQETAEFILTGLIKFNSQTRFMNNGRKIHKIKRKKSRMSTTNFSETNQLSAEPKESYHNDEDLSEKQQNPISPFQKQLISNYEGESVQFWEISKFLVENSELKNYDFFY